MPGKNATPLIGWHPKPEGLAERIRDAARNREMKLGHFLDMVLAEYLDHHGVASVASRGDDR